jgi:hypothetical protein
MRIVITGSEAPPPFGDPPGGLKNQRFGVDSCPKSRKKKVALSYFFLTIVAILSPSTTVSTINPVTHHNAKST